jgi:MFS family permease
VEPTDTHSKTRQQRALFAVAVAELLALTLWFSASAVAPQLEELWSLSTSQSVGLTLAVQIGFVAGALGLAVLGIPDRFNSRRIFVISGLIGAAANALLIGLDGNVFLLALGLRALTGAALAGVYPSGLKVMAGWFRSGRGMALGVLVGALTIGSAGPHLIRGLGFDWRGVVLGASALALIGVAIMQWGVADGPYETTTGRFSFGMVGKILRNRGWRLSTYGYLGHMWELYAMWTWTAAFLSASALASGWGDGWVPTATFAVIAIGGAGAWIAGVVADRRGRTLVAGTSMAVSGSCALLTPVVYAIAPPLTVALFLVWGFAVVADSAQFSTMATEVSSESERGTALTLQTAIGFLLTLITIRGIPILADAWGWQWAFPILAIGPMLGIAAMVTLKRSPHAAQLAGGAG